VLEHTQGVETILLNETDVIRHEIVGRIIKAYALYEANNPKKARLLV